MASAVMGVVSQRSLNSKKRGAGCKCGWAGFLPHVHLFQNIPYYYWRVFATWCNDSPGRCDNINKETENDAGLTSPSSSIFRPFGIVPLQQVRLAWNSPSSIDSMTRLLLPMMISIVDVAAFRKCDLTQRKRRMWWTRTAGEKLRR